MQFSRPSFTIAHISINLPQVLSPWWEQTIRQDACIWVIPCFETLEFLIKKIILWKNGPTLQIWSNPTPEDNDYDLNFFYLNLTTQYADAFTKVTAFLCVFFTKRFLKILLKLFICKNSFFFFFFRKGQCMLCVNI